MQSSDNPNQTIHPTATNQEKRIAKSSIEMLIASGAKLGNKKGAILMPLTNAQREHLKPSTPKN